MKWNASSLTALATACATFHCPAAYQPASIRPPAPSREFRGVWVATVNNIDWPSQPGLSTDRQQAELRAILDRALQLHLNAVVLQVRPAGDAFYASRFEPWSEYLTGRMGQAPKPYYDPLAFALEEAHRRGLELHAWFNPFRARHGAAKSTVAPTHISRTHPRQVKPYGGARQLWMDPGEAAIREHSLQVMLDVVRRYHIDGIHLDDYFYPYPERYASGGTMEFPDDASWNRYRAAGGTLARDDWRRQNVDEFIRQLYSRVKQLKPEVKVGLSPFGIWRPGHPAQIKGFDAYAGLYADARKWLAGGWVDYFAPQLYWAIDAKAQSFPVLLQWWVEQNAKQRHLWPGLSVYRHSSPELLNQVRRVRQQPGADGLLLWSAKTLLQDHNGTATRLAQELFTQPALPPAYTWLDHSPPAPPKLGVDAPTPSTLKVSWEATGTEPSWLWLLQFRLGKTWTTRIVPGRETARILTGPAPDVIALSAVDRCLNVGPPAVVAR